MMLLGEAEKIRGMMLLLMVGAGLLVAGLVGGQGELHCLAAKLAGDRWWMVLRSGSCVSPWSWQGYSLPCSPCDTPRPTGPGGVGVLGCAKRGN